MKSISIQDIDNILKNENCKVIDIRDNYVYSMGTIKGAINIPSNFLMVMPEKYLSKDKSYYLFCDYGVKSKKVVSYLSNLGYDVYNIIGGYNSYK